jgi:thiamine-phosphate pyrophosphorylase
MKSFDLSLYFVTDSSGLEEEQFLDIIEQACQSGVTLLQLREKEKSGLEYMNLARKVKGITDRYQIPLIIDDRIDIALAVDAAGVHVGQQDIPVSVARKLLGQDKIVGATAKTVAQALEAKENGADYLGVGAIYPTTTKVITVLTKVSTLDDICRKVDLPVVAIGGLNQNNISILKDSNMKGIAVVSAIMKSENPSQCTKELRAAIEEILSRKGETL